ncbi:MAG TPA: response regulator transcription factor [Nocardioidaceae bacterium]|nr:response regulator transcription factor [Nocardioidaceae bacterium]
MTGASPGSGAPRVLLVDDQELVRAGFRLILERAGFDVVGEASDGLEAVALADDLCPSVVLMDIRMPRMDGIEATRQIVRKNPEMRVLALTTFDLDEYVYAAVQAGASGFLLKDVPPDDLVHAVRVVQRGESMLAPSLTRRLLEKFVRAPRPGAVPNVWVPLTEQELRVAKCVARGLSNADIAAELFLSEATVKTYVSRLFTKLDVRDRVQVAVLAYETGLVQVGAG